MTHSVDYSKLSDAERILLAHELWASVSDESKSELCPLTPEQLQEIDRRCAAVDSGEIQCIPWEDAIRSLRNRE